MFFSITVNNNVEVRLSIEPSVGPYHNHNQLMVRPWILVAVNALADGERTLQSLIFVYSNLVIHGNKHKWKRVLLLLPLLSGFWTLCYDTHSSWIRTNCWIYVLDSMQVFIYFFLALTPALSWTVILDRICLAYGTIFQFRTSLKEVVSGKEILGGSHAILKTTIGSSAIAKLSYDDLVRIYSFNHRCGLTLPLHPRIPMPMLSRRISLPTSLPRTQMRLHHGSIRITIHGWLADRSLLQTLRESCLSPARRARTGMVWLPWLLRLEIDASHSQISLRTTDSSSGAW